ncbi:MAG: ABC transporter permease subunit [Candidatus Delongbacteria bacterium]|nr:ABC transporter permease subunit [Candidatus Delongbacteria bacterium]MBN2833786.1 ABC transporter permease subunit [Candidatus Delongbacteria bacterium]
MYSYIIRRILLMIPTFLGITILFFFILQIVPGGPLEQEILKLKQAQMMSGEGGATGSSMGGEVEISPEAMEKMKKFYGFDKPIIVRYLLWLGLWQRDVDDKETAIGLPYRFNVEYVRSGNDLYELQKWVKVEKENGSLKAYESRIGADFEFPGYAELPDHQDIEEWFPAEHWNLEELKGDSVRVFHTRFSGIITGNLGDSYTYREPVIKLIGERLHISAYFGILGMFLSYLICIPLGIYKAIKHNSIFDASTSVLIFIGYSIPGFALGILLLMFLGGGSFWDVFPLGDFRSPNFDEMDFWGKVVDQVEHTVLPIIAWSIGSFATMTVLMKNSLLENLGADYVRTAFSKGLSERRVIFVHAVRNSLIPLATGIGGVIGVIFAGSYLIEKTFNIDGIGLLSFNALLNRDYPITLGFLVVGSVIRLTGNLISDMCYALIDPRIRFK